MEIYKSHYWKLTIILQKSVGYWVFQDKRKSYAIWFYSYIILFSYIAILAIRLYNEIGVNATIVIENTIFIIYATGIIVKITATIILREKLKKLYVQLANDWKTIIDEHELKVMHKHAEIGRKITLTYTGFIVFSIGTFSVIPLSIPLLDYIVPIENQTRLKEFPIHAEYGIDQQKYFYPLIISFFIQGLTTIALLISFDLGYMMIVEHIIGLFTLIKYRLDKVAIISKSIENYNIDFFEGNRIAFRYGVNAIKLHQLAIRYVDEVESCYSLCCLYFIIVNMILFGTGFAIVFMKDSLQEKLRFTTSMIACSIHFYYLFLPGQKVINNSLEIFYSCYSCKWYNLSKKSKSLLTIMMIRSSRPCQFTAGKMFLMCMDTYGQMVKTGYSIFTLFR